MMKSRGFVKVMSWICFAILFSASFATAGGGGVYVRFKLIAPKNSKYYIRFSGYIHNPNWYLPVAIFPENANKDKTKQAVAGKYTAWFDLKKWAGKDLHGRMNRAGGVAEFPNVAVDFITEKKSPRREVVIELATKPNARAVVKKFREQFDGSKTTFLVSPNLAQDKDSLESFSQMCARHLKWAREASGGKRISPKKLILQTSFYGPNLPDAKVLSLLGLNMVGGQTEEMQKKFPELRTPGHSHAVNFGPAMTREQIDAGMKGQAKKYKGTTHEGIPFNFSDEICCRPGIGKNAAAIQHFHAWLAEQKIPPTELGVTTLSEVVPIETPTALKLRQKANRAAANRIFYYTSRFRQHAGTQRIKWATEAFHKYFPSGLLTSTLVADHPYFAGTGLGMGMEPNTAWGGAPLALDWFELARKKAVDLIGIEDWLGLQYMYWPKYTWEGFQLMGFQASIFRSGSQGTQPIISWITPSDETNLRLKFASSLSQGAKHYYFWTFGPTSMGTENYWSDLRGEYDGIVSVARQLAASEHIIAPGKPRKTRVALLYSISSDLWQPFGYIHMLERRATYLSLIHDQYLVDMLTEEDIEAGRLKNYAVLYATDPNITTKAITHIAEWVRAGGYLYGACNAGSRNEFNEEVPGLASVFGIDPERTTKVQSGEYRIRGNLNRMSYTDKISLPGRLTKGAKISFGVLGVKVKTKSRKTIAGKFKNGSPAVIMNKVGRGRTVWFGGCPGLSYLKDAKFVARELKEKWPLGQRKIINHFAEKSGASRLVQLSHPVVEAGIYDAPTGTALVLANFTYKEIKQLTVVLPLKKTPKTIRSVENGLLKFKVSTAPPALRKAGYSKVAKFTTKLKLNDILLCE